MNRTFRLTIGLIVFIVFPSLLFAFEHPAIMLKSVNSKKTYIGRIDRFGNFKIPNVKAGTYCLSLIAPKDFFVAASSSGLPVKAEKLVWTTATAKYMNVINMEIPPVVLTSVILAHPIPSGVGNREAAVVLNSSLITKDAANLSGSLTNLPKEEY